MDDNRFTFWYYWLLAATFLNLAIALAIAFIPDSFLFSMHTEAMAQIYFQGDWPEGAEQVRQLFFGIIGGTLVGYFLLQSWIVWYPFHDRKPWAWHAVLWAMMAWFLIDSSLSIRHGAIFNVWMINIWPLILILLPLVMTKRYFR